MASRTCSAIRDNWARSPAARLTSAARCNLLARPRQGVRGRLTKGSAVVVRKLAEVPEAVRQRDGLYQGHSSFVRPQRGSGHAHPPQLQVAVRADAEDGLEGISQGRRRYRKDVTEFL